jgi:hypothetical protein
MTGSRQQSKKINVLIVGDSLSFPRPSSKQVLESTWPWLLEKDLGCRIIHRARGGSNALHVLEDLRQIRSYFGAVENSKQFDYAIVQFGIVDCCPRTVPLFLYKILGKIPLGHRFASLLEKNKLMQRIYHRPWISEKKFRNKLLEIQKELDFISENKIFIQIAKPCNYLVKNVGDFSSIVNNYNRIISGLKEASVIAPYPENDEIKSFILPDGHHLNELGHKAVAHAVYSHIQCTASAESTRALDWGAFPQDSPGSSQNHEPDRTLHTAKDQSMSVC